MTSITITIPKKGIKVWLKELYEAMDSDLELWFKIPTIPRKAIIGDKCYVIHDNQIIGYHIIKAFKYTNGFTCKITEKYWGEGNYVVRDAKSWVKLNKPVLSKSHRGYRYLDCK